MTTIYMDVDAALSEAPVNLLPLIDDTDFKTRETAIAYNAAGMDLVWNFITTAGAFTQTAVTPTTGGVYDWAHQGDGIYTIEIPASGGGSINNDSEGFGWFSGVVTGVLPFRGPVIGFRAAALNNALIDGGDVLDVSLTEIGGVVQSATDLKDFADAGYDPDTNKVQGVVLVDTTTVNSDMVAAAPTAVAVRTEIDSNSTQLAAIVADTDEIQAELADGGRTDNLIDAILLDTGTTIPGQLDSMSGAGFVTGTDSLEAIRDRGDAAWITGGGGGITDLLNLAWHIPRSIDLANTAAWRLGIALTNGIDDLPTTAEITPGTIDIDRKAIGGTSWSNVVSGAACSEAAGLIYYDEVFDAGSGYAEGDSLRFTFKSQKITVAANDYEISDATGRIIYSEIRVTERGTDSAYTGTPPTAVAIRTEIDSNSTQLAAIVEDTNELQTDDTPAAIAALPTALENADAVWDELLSGASHNIATSAGRRLRGIQEFQGYESGAIWIDTINGTAGTVDYENGTVENPVDSIADANTIAASLGLVRFSIAPGSAITLAASQQNQVFEGRGWTLALGSQSITGTLIRGAAVSGIGTGSGFTFEDCSLGTMTIGGGTFKRCALTAALTISAAADYFLDACYSGIAGTSTPSIDFGAAVANSGLNMRHYSGGIEILNMGGTGTDNMSLEGFGQLIINANCSGGTVAIRGAFTVTDNAGGALTLSEVARLDIANIWAAAARTLTANTNLNDPTAAAIRTEIDSNSTQLAAIVEDSNELQTDWTDGGRLDLIADAIVEDTNELQTDNTPAAITGVVTAITALGTLLGPLVNAWADGGRLDLLIDDILADSNELQADWVDGGRLDLLIDSIVSAIVGTISEITGASDIPATPTAKQALALLYMFIRNDNTATAAARGIVNDAGAEVLTAAQADDNTTYNQGKLG